MARLFDSSRAASAITRYGIGSRFSHMPSKKQGATVEVQLTPDTSQTVVLLRGAPDHAPVTRLTGKVVVSNHESFTAKKITLKLVATMRLKWDEQVQVNRMQSANHPIRYEKTAFEQEIDMSDLMNTGNSRASSNPGSGRVTPNAGGSMSNLTSYFASHNATSTGHSSQTTSPQASSPHTYMSRTSSSLSLHHLTNNKKDIILTSGTHQLPFEMFIPGNSPESIEGNENAQIVYWLIATVERGRFQHNLTARKHIRIMRTLSIDTYDAAQSISIENVWPKKVEYTIEVPSKALPIGGSAQVHFNLQPLLKGLTPGRIKLSLVQTLVMHLPTTQSTSIDSVVVEKSYPPPELTSLDEWVFARTIDLPTSLSKVTPDTLVQPNVKVTHKLKVVVGLKNADGHTSELRASLPVTLFISPRIPVVANDVHVMSLAGISAGTERIGDEHLVFATRTSKPQDEDDGAPPNYRNHIYDRLFSEVATPLTPSSPVQSGGSTPALRGNIMSSMNSMNATEREQLTSRLRALQLSRENEGPINISPTGTPANVQTLSRVPSYDHALHDLASGDAAPDYT